MITWIYGRLIRWALVMAAGVLPVLLGGATRAAEPASRPRYEFTRMLAHWADYGNPDYLPFVLEAEPDLVQLGFYGGHFYSLVHTPAYKGYPAHFPVQGINECGAWFEEKNEALHERGIKVVGHFNVEFLVGDPDSPEGPTGFFKFYRDLWDEKELGPKPVADPTTMLETRAGRQADRPEGLRNRQDARILGLPPQSALAGGDEGLGQARDRAGRRWLHRQLFLPAQLPLRALPRGIQGVSRKSGIRRRS